MLKRAAAGSHTVISRSNRVGDLAAALHAAELYMLALLHVFLYYLFCHISASCCFGPEGINRMMPNQLFVRVSCCLPSHLCMHLHRTLAKGASLTQRVKMHACSRLPLSLLMKKNASGNGESQEER